MRLELPKIKTVFISAVTGEGLLKLKDMIWAELNRSSDD
jgi:hypothetical protein